MVKDTSPERPERPIIKALLEAKKKFGPLVKDKTNPFYKSKYADLAALMDVVEDPLLEQGVVISQPTRRWPDGVQYINTELKHVSGDQLDSTLDLPAGLDAQKTCAAITYLKRAALQAILGIPARDDDGESAVGRGQEEPPYQPTPKVIPGFGKQPKPKEEPKPDATKPNAGLASVTIKSIGVVKISGVEAPILHTSGGDFIVDPRKPTSKDIMAMAQKASIAGAMVVLDYQTSEKTGNNLVNTIRMEG